MTQAVAEMVEPAEIGSLARGSPSALGHNDGTSHNPDHSKT